MESKRRSTPFQLDYLGKIPPQSVDFEEVVLGTMMIEPSIIPTISQILSPDCFYKEAHQHICSSIYQLQNEGNPVDILTVTKQLRKNGNLELCGGAFYVSQLTNRVSSAANTEYHARVIVEKFLMREVIRLSTENIQQAYEDTTDLFQLIQKTDNDSSHLNQYIVGSETNFDFNAEINKTIERIVAPKSSESNGLSTGLEKLNNLIGGWNSPDFILLAARPGMGKTDLALNFALKSNAKVAIFSLEMDKRQLINRLITNITKINNYKIRNKNLTEEELYLIKEAGQTLNQKPLYLNDKISNLAYIRSVCSERKRKHGLELIIIDYIQLIEPENSKDTREQQISKISRGLKKLAKDLSIPIIALSQLSRECESRNDKRPVKSDLRESGQLEQDADIILTVYRPSEYYDFLQDKDYKDSVSSENEYKRVAEIGVIKHRHGDTGIIKACFFGEYSQFTDDTNDFGSYSLPTLAQQNNSRIEDKSEVPF